MHVLLYVVLITNQWLFSQTKWRNKQNTVTYMCTWGIDFALFPRFSIWFWNCSVIACFPLLLIIACFLCPSIKCSYLLLIYTGYLFLLTDTPFQVTCCGVASAWEFYAVNSGTVQLMVFRPTTGNKYLLIGSTTIIVPGNYVNNMHISC